MTRKGGMMKAALARRLLWLFLLITAFSLTACGGSSDPAPEASSMSVKGVMSLIGSGRTAPDAKDRVLLVDVRSSNDYIEGHVPQSLTVPLEMIADNGKALYTNGFDRLDTTASTTIKDSWLSHMLVNQLVNDFAATYQDAEIIFYGETVSQGRTAKELAKKIGFTRVSYMSGSYEDWKKAYPSDIEMNYSGIESVNLGGGSFVMTGYINNTNYANVSTKGTHHAITFKGGGLHNNAIFQVNLAPFCFQEMLTYLGANPLGNMADGIFFGDMSVWRSKFTSGQAVVYSVTWDGAAGYYDLHELFEEKASFYQPDPATFKKVGFEARIGGTRESNLNWNPGCIFCFYSCVCGITSSGLANEDTWFADGGLYNEDYADMRNYHAGRYYPKAAMLPAAGQPVKIKVSIVPL